MFQKIKKIKIRTVILFIIFQIFFFIVTAPFAVFYGPFTNVKNTVVGMSWNSLNHKYIARLFLSDKEILKILSDNSVLSPLNYNTNVNVLKFGPKNSDRIEVYEIEGRLFKGKVMVVSNPKKVVVGYSSKMPQSGETTSEIAKRNNAIAAINAGGFANKSLLGTGGIPMGFVIHDGKIRYNTIKETVTQDTAAITKDGLLIVGLHTVKQLRKYGIKEGVSFGPPLIVNGEPVVSSGDGGWGIAPRTAIAQTKDGKIIFLTVDGRILSSLGATLKDLQDILLDFKAYNAVNLDGGSSTTMFFNGKIINKPSDPLGERKVPTVFMVIP